MSSINVNGIKAVSSLSSASSVDGTETLVVDTSNGVKKMAMSVLTSYLIAEVLDDLPAAEEVSF